MFRGKEFWPKMTWNWDLTLLGKFVVNVHYAAMKDEIIRKPMVLEKIEVSSLKFAYCWKKNLEMIPYLFNKFQRSKLEGLWNMTEIKITEGYGNFLDSTNMDMP